MKGKIYKYIGGGGGEKKKLIPPRTQEEGLGSLRLLVFVRVSIEQKV